MLRPRHHRDHSENEEVQLPVPKRMPIIWSDEDDTALAETSSWEIRIWRKVKELYGIDATDIIPPNTTVSFLSDRGTNNIPVWAETARQRLIRMSKCPSFKRKSRLKLLHYSILLARYYRLPHSSLRRSNDRMREFLKTQNLQPPEVSTNLPKHSDYTRNIKNCAEEDKIELSVALEISALDFETIINS